MISLSRKENELIIISIMSAVLIGILFFCDLTTYKTVGSGYILTTVPAYLFPLTFAINNMLVEMWGKKVALIIVISCIALEMTLDAAISLVAIYFGSIHPEYSAYYKNALSPIWVGGLDVLIGIILGSVTNTLLMSFLKDRFSFKTFPMRAIFSSFLGEIVFTLCAFEVWFSSDKLANPIQMAVVSMMLKLFFIVLLAYPCYLLSCFLIKKTIKPGAIYISRIYKFSPEKCKSVYEFVYSGTRSTFLASANEIKARTFFQLQERDKKIISSDLVGTLAAEIELQKARFSEHGG